MDDERQQPRDHVVVTRVAPVRENGREVVHTYGPYGKAKAKSVKSNFLAEARLLGYAARLKVSVCKMIDVEAMNRQMAASIAAEILK